MKDLTYHVAPEDQGQMVEYAYAADAEHDRMVRRVTDRSDGSVRYQVADAPDRWEPWNRAPEPATWTPALE